MATGDPVRRGRGRPRRAEADGEILDAALDLLRTGGYRALSLDEVARRAGTAKSSIYRRWPSKAALAADVVRREAESLPDSADSGAALRAFAALVAGPLGGVVASLIGEAEESAETRTTVIALLAPFRRPDDDRHDLLLGGILFRRLLGA